MEAPEPFFNAVERAMAGGGGGGPLTEPLGIPHLLVFGEHEAFVPRPLVGVAGRRCGNPVATRRSARS
jgi:hypothetical protein